MRILRGLLFQIVLWIFIPLLAIAVLAGISLAQHNQMRGYVSNDVARLSRVVAAHLSVRLGERIDRFSALAEAIAVLPVPVQVRQDLADRLQKLHKEFDRGLVLLDPSGVVVAVAGDVQPWLAQPEVASLQAQTAANRPELATASLGHAAGEPLFLLAQSVPWPGASGSTGLLIGAFSSTSLGMADLMVDLQIGQNGVGYVVDGQGRVIYRPQEKTARQDATPLPGAHQMKQVETSAFFYVDSGGVEWVVGHAPVAATGWDVVVSAPWQEIIKPIGAWEFSATPPVLMLVATLAALAAAILMVWRVILPLRRLNEITAQIAWGDFQVADRPAKGVQEIRDLHLTLRDMATQIQRYQAGLQSYVAAVTQGQEAERKRLARELHDDTAQALVGLIQRIKLAQRDLTRNPERVSARLAELETLTTSAWQDVRQFCDRLRPPGLDQVGLVPALMSLTEPGPPAAGPVVTLKVLGPEQPLSPDLELAVFRIVQEGLNNVHQHAQAQSAQIELQFGGDGLHVAIEDDGVGFTPPLLPHELVQQGHLGLAGMHERIQLVGGSLTVASAPGSGSRLHAFIPYHRSG
jgi:signal transduction histidine kinase